MKVKFLSAKNYTDKAPNYGDCVLIDSGTSLVVFDCGHEEHAKRVLEYMKIHSYKSADFILSHNDKDHFDGLPFLIEAGVISKVYTLLLLKYKDELREIIGDRRITDDSLTKRIAEKYNNIYSLSNSVELVDALELPALNNNVKIVGPQKDAALAAVAKFLDNREGNTLDGETIYNAICFQAKVTMDDGKSMLLCGDSAVSMIEENVKSCTYIQLPHHGKYELAEKVFAIKDAQKIAGVKYYVSDNTGNTNGGSDTLKQKAYGHSVTYTTAGDIEITKQGCMSGYIPGKSYGVIR